MTRSPESLVLDAYRRAVAEVPAYRALVEEAGITPGEIHDLGDFQRLPVLEKRTTFRRFRIDELCANGSLGRPGFVLTSSGHSGVFAFGLTDADALSDAVQWIDDALDLLFSVRSRRTLLINGLPMGVKVHTHACTLAETSVRPDMVVGLAKAFGRHFEQLILVGEAAFVKRVLEMGKREGVDWRARPVHVILGEETLAENARSYLGGILGHDLRRPENGVVVSSMGVAELGLNLFFEVPPVAPLVSLRHLLHENQRLRRAVLGETTWVPSLFTYDPQRIFVEFDSSDRLIVTTLDLRLRIPLIRYATGDRGTFVRLPVDLRDQIDAPERRWEVLNAIPIVAIRGRGDFALFDGTPVHPEAVKEGIYRDVALAGTTTANFRLVAGAPGLIRLQLSPGVQPSEDITAAFQAAIAHYVPAPYSVVCERYEAFRSGMELDYERKFQYLGP